MRHDTAEPRCPDSPWILVDVNPSVSFVLSVMPSSDRRPQKLVPVGRLGRTPAITAVVSSPLSDHHRRRGPRSDTIQQPRPRYLHYLDHLARLANAAAEQREDPDVTPGSPITGNRWSHPCVKTSPEVVSFTWQPTPRKALTAEV